jgi:type IV pilus assembly protein PilV
MKFKGFTLIETLTSLLTLSVGLLGLAGLQVSAVHYSYASHQRTLVNIQALDMAERMWSHLKNPLSELKTWQSLNQESLPGWRGKVSPVADQPDSYVITVSWIEKRLGNANTVSFSYPLTLPKVNE